MEKRRVVIIVELKSKASLKDLKQGIKDSLLRWDYEVLRVQGRIVKVDAAMRRTYCRG